MNEVPSVSSNFYDKEARCNDEPNAYCVQGSGIQAGSVPGPKILIC